MLRTPSQPLPFFPQQIEPGTRSHCPYCAFQCGLTLTRTENGYTASPDPAFPVNNGQMCIKGFTSGQLLTHPDRLLHPLKRSPSGELQPISWDQALDEIADKLLSIRDTHGADANACFGSGSLTNEKAYLLGKFARVALRTSSIDYNGRYCMASAAAGANRAFGIDRGLPFPLSDIPYAKTVLLWGSNLAETLPPIMQYFDRQRLSGGRLIVADPRATPTARAADLHLQLTPGSDLILANALLHLAIEMKLIDPAYIAARTNGFEAVRASVSRYSPEIAERATGISLERMRTTVRWLAEDTAMLLSGRGPEQQSKGADTVTAFTNLMLALGKVGKHFSGFGTLTGQGNGQGGREHGQKADQLPGYRLIENESHRANVAALWDIDPADLPRKGKSAVELLSSLGTSVKSLLVFGSNILVASPDADALERRLESLDLLVVSDIFLNETAQHAHYVLPVTQWAEEEGTLTNLEGRILHRRPMVTPPMTVRSDLFILTELAKRLGDIQRFNFRTSREVFNEFRTLTAGSLADYSGVTYERLDEQDGLQWPVPYPDHPGTPRLFETSFPTPDGRARFTPVEHRPEGDPPNAEYPFYLTTGRYKKHYNSGAQTRRVDRLREADPEPLMEIHPRAAAMLNIASGDQVLVSTRRATATFTAQLTSDIRPDTIFIPFHYGSRQSVNRLTAAVLDPTSKMPEFKLCAASVRSVLNHRA